jgi:hypothetical protein
MRTVVALMALIVISNVVVTLSRESVKVRMPPVLA